MKKLLGVLSALLILAGCSLTTKTNVTENTVTLDDLIKELGSLEGFESYEGITKNNIAGFEVTDSHLFFIHTTTAEVKVADMKVYNGKGKIEGQEYTLKNKALTAISRSHSFEPLATPNYIPKGWDFLKLTVKASSIRTYNPKNNQEKTEADTQKGKVFHYALLQEGTKLSIKVFNAMPNDKTEFDGISAQEYTKK